MCLLGCRDGDDNIFIANEHAERKWLPERHAGAIKAMLARHQVRVAGGLWTIRGVPRRPLDLADVKRFVAELFFLFSSFNVGVQFLDLFVK